MTPFEIPDMSVFRGHAGLRRFFAEWLQTFPDASNSVEDVDERGDWTLSTVLQVVSGASSGTPVPFRYYGIGHWRDGRLDFVQNHPNLERARTAFERYASETEPIPVAED